jgi:hypothetical protein
MFMEQLLQNTTIEMLLCTGPDAGSRSHLIYVFQEGVIEQLILAVRDGSLFCNLSDLWILGLVNNAQAGACLSI